MDQWLFTLLTVIITGLFTLTAALGAQSRAAKQADEHRKDDLQRSQNEADVRAVATFLRSAQSLQDQWRHQSALENKLEVGRAELRDKVREALDARMTYLNSLLTETEALYLGSQNNKVANQAGLIFAALGTHFAAVAHEYAVVNEHIDESSLRLKRAMILLGFEDKLRPHLLDLRNELVAIAKLELSSTQEDPEAVAGMFT